MGAFNSRPHELQTTTAGVDPSHFTTLRFRLGGLMIFSTIGPRVYLSWLAFDSRAGIMMIRASEPYSASLPQTALSSLPSLIWEHYGKRNATDADRTSAGRKPLFQGVARP
jgi:hypothetical protein